MLLEDLQVVLKVAEFRSITAAATHLDMRTATASAAVKRVESVLGVELFIRTTRQLRLSGAGERYIPQCEQALLMLDQARQNMKDDLDSVDGELRIALSSDLGRNLVTPWLDEFMETYQDVSLRTNISDSNIDLYRDYVDIALRYGSPDDANLYGFKVCNVPVLLCATQDYLDKNGTPEHPHDLASHNGRKLATSVLNQGPFPPPALPGFPGTTGLSATPPRPACPSRAPGWSSFTTPRGFP